MAGSGQPGGETEGSLPLKEREASLRRYFGITSQVEFISHGVCQREPLAVSEQGDATH